MRFIWISAEDHLIRRGNCSVTMLEEILRQHYNDIEALGMDSVNGVLTLF